MAIKFEPDPAKADKPVKRDRGGAGTTPRKAGLPAQELRKRQRDKARIALRRAESKKKRRK